MDYPREYPQRSKAKLSSRQIQYSVGLDITIKDSLSIITKKHSGEPGPKWAHVYVHILSGNLTSTFQLTKVPILININWKIYTRVRMNSIRIKRCLVTLSPSILSSVGEQWHARFSTLWIILMAKNCAASASRVGYQESKNKPKEKKREGVTRPWGIDLLPAYPVMSVLTYPGQH